MKIQTMSIVVGSKACNAFCKFCISKQTPMQGFDPTGVNKEKINWRNFDIALNLAKMSGVTTILLTGKGEPTLYPELITAYLEKINKTIPFLELQTNGIALENTIFTTKDEVTQAVHKTDASFFLRQWYAKGLTTVCISMVHYDSARNHLVYQPSTDNGYMNLDKVIENILSAGLMVRLSCVGLKGFIDSKEELDNLIKFAKAKGCKQLTYRPMHAAGNVHNDVTEWISQHAISQENLADLQKFIESRGTEVLSLPHGATIYDVDGQNICWTNAMENKKTEDDMRQIIFFPDGKICYRWDYEGALLLG